MGVKFLLPLQVLQHVQEHTHKNTCCFVLKKSAFSELPRYNLRENNVRPIFACALKQNAWRRLVIQKIPKFGVRKVDNTKIENRSKVN
jgi:hypothetical protein